jgi:alpha-tubulin suppressor-like RCC1 family protein
VFVIAALHTRTALQLACMAGTAPRQGQATRSCKDPPHTQVVLSASGTVSAWGDGSFGVTDLSNITDVQGQISSVSAGGWHSCALLRDSSLRCWGKDESHQSSRPSKQNGIKAVATGGDLTAALLTNDSVLCWGDGCSMPVSQPGFKSVAAGWKFSAGLDQGGVATRWGGWAVTDRDNATSYWPAAPPEFTLPMRDIVAGAQYLAGAFHAGAALFWIRCRP